MEASPLHDPNRTHVPQEPDAQGVQVVRPADHLRLRTGRDRIVGPNGSGKSNVVDALAWVMGEQGAKTLRGGKMEDVIFAGTAATGPARPRRGQLTIDNADGALPIEYSEVTISRTLFRNGGASTRSTATLPAAGRAGAASDSGLGREMHVIVGQGQLDRCCRPRPKSGAASSRRPPASSSTVGARRRPSASSRRWRQPGPGAGPVRGGPPPARAAVEAGEDRPEGPAHPVRRPRCPVPPAGR